MSREIRHVVVAPGVGVRPAHGVIPAALQDPPESHLVADHAVDDTQMRKIAERLETRTPNVVLERGVTDSRDSCAQQQLQDTEENRQGPHRELIAWRRHESGSGTGHAFLDLIPADRRAAHRPRELMRQRGLACTYRAADNHESRQRCHQTFIATINQPVGAPPYERRETSGRSR